MVKRKDPLYPVQKKIQPVSQIGLKTIVIIDYSSALEEIVPNSLLFTAAPKPNTNFAQETIKAWTGETDAEVRSTESCQKLSKTKMELPKNLDILSN